MGEVLHEVWTGAGLWRLGEVDCVLATYYPSPYPGDQLGPITDVYISL